MTTLSKSLIGVVLAVTLFLSSSSAQAGDYSGVTIGPPAVLMISGNPYACVAVLAPASSKFTWCVPTNDPLAGLFLTVAAAGYVKNGKFSVGCDTSCRVVATDSLGSYWYPQWFVGG
jgi:hypothetical protein